LRASAAVLRGRFLHALPLDKGEALRGVGPSAACTGRDRIAITARILGSRRSRTCCRDSPLPLFGRSIQTVLSGVPSPIGGRGVKVRLRAAGTGGPADLVSTTRSLA